MFSLLIKIICNHEVVKKEVFVIVNQSRRKESAVQFLDNLSKLPSDVIAWCNKQNKRKDNYGLIDLYDKR